MSILIKGMEMPKSCEVCPVRDYEEGHCLLSNERSTLKVPKRERASWCPLIELPPHGRLIDADAFEKKNAYFWGMDFINAKYEDCLCDLVNDAPTIIEAEGD